MPTTTSLMPSPVMSSMRSTTEPCPPFAPEDLDHGVVDFDDLPLLRAAWGSCEECPEDINGDGVVDFDDLLVLLASWS